MSLLRLLGALAFSLILAACAHEPTPRGSARDPTILIAIDGFRADYIDRGITPNLSALAAGGARGAMRPSFPTKTFPNHYSMVTGLRPDRHGIVDNTMEDPSISGVTFRLADKVVTADPRWWSEATPIWISAGRAGIRTASMFWPGTDVEIQGGRPADWVLFDQSVPSLARVDQVLAWMDRPPAQRPGFVTLYFDEVDTVGHREGPDSALLNAAVVRADDAIGRLTRGLAARGIAANLVIVADHGMAPVSAERAIYLDDLLPADAGRTLALGAFMTYVPAPGREGEVEAALLKAHPHMECWRKGEIPARYHYGTHRRVPPIFCLPQTGWEISTKPWIAARGLKGGNHGFDPYSPEMRAVFVAHGPAFRPGVRTPDFDNVDVYPLLARLLGLTPQGGDGDLEELGPTLAQ